MSGGKLVQPIFCKSSVTMSAHKQMPKHAEEKLVLVPKNSKLRYQQR
jgi:hypothetical protein